MSDSYRGRNGPVGLLVLKLVVMVPNFEHDNVHMIMSAKEANFKMKGVMLKIVIDIHQTGTHGLSGHLAHNHAEMDNVKDQDNAQFMNNVKEKTERVNIVKLKIAVSRNK